MSRIQDILNKAEREGALRRTHGPASADPPVPDAPEDERIISAGRRARVDRLPERTPAGDVPFEDLPPAASTPRPAPVTLATGSLSPLLVSAIAPHAIAAEQYRSLRTRITHSENGHPRRVLMVSSPGKGDGKTLTASNLALTMAQEPGRRVVLVDGDLRRPSLHHLLGLPARQGLSEVLQGTAALDEALVFLPDYALTVLPSGMPPEHPAELLGSAAMRRVLDTLRTRFDRVVIDTPPAVPLADVGVLSPMVDGLMLVVRAGVTPKPLIQQAIAVVDAPKLLGLVLNDAGETAAYGAYEQVSIVGS